MIKFEIYWTSVGYALYCHNAGRCLYSRQKERWFDQWWGDVWSSNWIGRFNMYMVMLTMFTIFRIYINLFASDLTGVSECSTFWFSYCSWKCWFPSVRQSTLSFTYFLLFPAISSAELRIDKNWIFVQKYSLKIEVQLLFLDFSRYENSSLSESQISKLVTESLAAVGLKVCL